MKGDSKPDFERVRTALMLEGEPDRVPLFELKIDRDVCEAFMGRPVRDVKSNVEFWLAAGYDFIRIRPPYVFPGESQPAFGDYSAYQEGNRQINWVKEGTGAISSWEDFEKYPWPDPHKDVGYKCLAEAAHYLPPGMKIIGSVNGIFEHTWMLMGFENFCFSLVERPDLVEAVFNKVGEFSLEVFTTIMEHKQIGAMWMTDDLAYYSGPMIRPDYYRRYLFPWYRRMAALCQEADLPFLFHSDGRLWEVMDDLVEIGFNALHPIEPKAMDIKEVKAKYGDKLCLCGNIDLAYTLTLGTPEEVRTEVRQRIKDVAPGGGYCLGSSNSVTNYVPIENYRAMIEAALEYGKYPINL